YSGIIRDITQRRRADEILNRLRHLHEVILTQAGEGIYGLDSAGMTTFVNPTAARLLGYDPSELLQQPMHTRLHHSRPDGSHYPAEDCPIYRALRDGLVHRVDTEVFWRKDGTAVPVEYVCTPILERGMVAGAVVVFRDITERREAEQAVEESQGRFRQLAEHIKEVFWITDPAKERIIYISPGYEETWGRSCDSLYAAPHSWMEAIHPEDQPRVRAATSRQGLGTYHEEYRIVRPDGSMRWIWDRAYPIRDPSGTVYRIVGLAEDVTDRKRVEAALIESEQRYRVLFNDNPSMYFMVDTEGTVLSVNRCGAERLGYRVEDLLGTQVLDVFHQNDREAVRRYLTDCLAEMGTVKCGECRQVHKDGRVIWARITAQGVPNEHQGPVILIVCEDITAIKETELALRASEERLEYVIRGSNDGFWDGLVLPGDVWHSPSTPVWWSPRVREMLGYNEEEFPNVLDSWGSRLHPEDRADAFRQLAACIEGASHHYDAEYRLLNKQGEYRWFHARAEVVQRNEQGRAVRMAGSLQCITDRKRAEALLRVSEERLRMALTASEVGIWDWDVRSGDLYWSAGVEALFGLAAGSFPGTYDAYIDAVYLEDRGTVMASIDQSVADQASVNIRHRIVWANGTLHWLAWTGRIYRDAEGIATRVLGIVHETKGPH
ncbi:MAG: PAS domain-containing protein, partial [Nitrospirota bacterium]|nr:PAS domain-containing protein [Nitrospirota bacterium]